MSSDIKIQIKLNRPALERLIGDDKDLELVFSKQALQEIINNHMDIVEKQVKDRLENGFSPELNLQLNKRIEGLVECKVGNYLRIYESKLTKMIYEEVNKQLPNILKNKIDRILKGKLEQMKELIDE